MHSRTPPHKALFNRFARDYDQCAASENGWAGPRMLSEKLVALGTIRQEVVIHEVGIGTGLVFEALKARLPISKEQYYGCDLAGNMIRKASKRIPRSNLKCLDASKERLPWPDQSADITCSIGVFQFLSNRRFACKEMVRTTKKSGLIAISALTGQEKIDGSPEEEKTDWDRDSDIVKLNEITDLMSELGLEILLSLKYLSYYHQYSAYRINHYDELVIARV